jgi:hypothetical protein
MLQYHILERIYLMWSFFGEKVIIQKGKELCPENGIFFKSNYGKISLTKQSLCKVILSLVTVLISLKS